MGERRRETGGGGQSLVSPVLGDAAGVVRLRLHREADVASVSDLLVYSLEACVSRPPALGALPAATFASYASRNSACRSGVGSLSSGLP